MQVVPGHVLTGEDVEALRVLVARRDQHNQRLYRDISVLTRQLAQAQEALARGRLGRLQYVARRVISRLTR